MKVLVETFSSDLPLIYMYVQVKDFILKVSGFLKTV